MNQLFTDRLILDEPNNLDSSAVLNFRICNRNHLDSWEPLRDEFYYSAQGVEDHLNQLSEQVRSGIAIHWFLKLKNCEAIIGTCSFTNIIMGPFQACNLGFAIDFRSQGIGLMREALILAINRAFADRSLHRIMANYRPENIRSEKLLTKLGFVKEGYAKSYLKIKGKWEDHVLTSLVRSD